MKAGRTVHFTSGKSFSQPLVGSFYISLVEVYCDSFYENSTGTIRGVVKKIAKSSFQLVARKLSRSVQFASFCTYQKYITQNWFDIRYSLCVGICRYSYLYKTIPNRYVWLLLLIYTDMYYLYN